MVRKPIKNLHLGVCPPAGRVHVAVPPTVSDDAVRLAVIGELGWIRRHRERFAAQPRQAEGEMVSGVSHYSLGRRYRLHVVRCGGRARVRGRLNAGPVFSGVLRDEIAHLLSRGLPPWFPRGG